jgi:hypothetical protein
MAEALLFLEEFQAWIYLALGLAVLIYLRVTWRWYQSRRSTIFSWLTGHGTARSTTLLGLAITLSGDLRRHDLPRTAVPASGLTPRRRSRCYTQTSVRRRRTRDDLCCPRDGGQRRRTNRKRRSSPRPVSR